MSSRHTGYAVHSIFFVMAAWEVEICDVQSNLESLLAALKTYVRLAGILTKRAPLLAGSTACGAGNERYVLIRDRIAEIHDLLGQI